MVEGQESDMIRNAVMGSPPSPNSAPTKADAGSQPMFNELMQEISGVSRRMRVMEERFTNLRRKNQVTETNVVSNNKKIFKELKATTQEISELRVDIKDIKDKMKVIISELKLYALKEDVKVLEKYLNIWEPVRFVTQKDVEMVVKDVLHKHGIKVDDNQEKKVK